MRPELIADRDEVLAPIDDDTVNIIDALPEAHYRGEISIYARPGHIPGASNIPVFSLVDDTGRYRPNDELAKIFDGDRDNRAITYCGGGIAASSNAFIMTRLGFSDVAVYTASLQEWAADPANPLETAADLDTAGKEIRYLLPGGIGNRPTSKKIHVRLITSLPGVERGLDDIRVTVVNH